MPIEDRNLKAGTRLVARYKGQEHTAEVVETEEGLRYRLTDGREFKSPSSAGKAVMGGTACNGWRFWSLAGDPAEKPAGPDKDQPAVDKTVPDPKPDAETAAKKTGTAKAAKKS